VDFGEVVHHQQSWSSLKLQALEKLWRHDMEELTRLHFLLRGHKGELEWIGYGIAELAILAAGNQTRKDGDLQMDP